MKLSRWISALCLTAMHASLWASPPAATVTIADGEAIVIRTAAKLALTEGVRLKPDDIVETRAKGRLVRIEFADGVALGLGAETRVLLAPPGLGSDSAASMPIPAESQPMEFSYTGTASRPGAVPKAMS